MENFQSQISSQATKNVHDHVFILWQIQGEFGTAMLTFYRVRDTDNIKLYSKTGRASTGKTWASAWNIMSN